MIIPASKITEVERLGLRMMALNLQGLAAHPLTKKLACLLSAVSYYEPARTFETALLDESENAMETAWQNMFQREQARFVSEFHAAKECRFAARSIGCGMAESFADNLKDAAIALQIAEHKVFAAVI